MTHSLQEKEGWGGEEVHKIQEVQKDFRSCKTPESSGIRQLDKYTAAGGNGCRLGSFPGTPLSWATHTPVSDPHKLVGSPGQTWVEQLLESASVLMSPRRSVVIPRWRRRFLGVSCIGTLLSVSASILCGASSSALPHVLAAMILRLSVVEPAGHALKPLQLWAKLPLPHLSYPPPPRLPRPT